MEKRYQDSFCIHYGHGVCNVARKPKDFYAENIKSDYKLKCAFISLRRDK